MSDKEKESLKAQNKYLIYKQVGHYARDCPNKGLVSTAYQQVSYNKKPWQQRTPFQGSRPWPSTAALDVMRPSSDDRKHRILHTTKVSCAILVQINGRDAQVLLDPCIQHGNLISNQFCDMYKIPIEQTEQKILETAVKGSKSYINSKATVEVDIQGHKKTIVFYVANLKEWNARLGDRALTTLKAVMDITENKVTIHPKNKEPIELQMLDKQVMKFPSTVAQYIKETAETVTDYSEAEIYAGHRNDLHLQIFIEDMDWEDNSEKKKKELSTIEEESEPEEDHTQK